MKWIKKIKKSQKQKPFRYLREFKEEDISKYAGEWIAIIDQKVVAHSKDFKDINEILKERYPKKRPLITKLPLAMPTVLSID